MTYQGITATMGGQRDLGVKSKLTRNPTPNSQHVPSGSPYPPQSFEFFQVSPDLQAMEDGQYVSIQHENIHAAYAELERRV